MINHREVRGSDKWGSGAYGAKRGNRLHNGIDFVAIPGDYIKPFVCGCVTKIGYPYNGDFGYRYIEITDDEGNRARYFYLQPVLELRVGYAVRADTIIGCVQDLKPRYKGITNHVHFEVKRGDVFLDPVKYLEKLDPYPEYRGKSCEDKYGKRFAVIKSIKLLMETFGIDKDEL